ncbi:MAG: DNA alkylation repair protein [Muribaculaceae bacterium]
MVKYDVKGKAGDRLVVRRAVEGDLPRMAEVFEAARRYMAANGNPTQWGSSSPDIKLVVNDISRRDSYVIEDEKGRIIATFALMTMPDHHYTFITDGPGWIYTSRPYMTLHRVATDGSARGIMPLIFAWASSCCDHLRIDTHADNATMLRQIEHAGFSFRGIVTMDDGTPRRAFQRITTSEMTAADITECLVSQQNERQRIILSRFFKTGKGEYGEGDRFLGLKVPQTRAVVREAKLKMTLPEIAELMKSEWHEVRLAGFLLLADEMKAAMPRRGKDTAENALRRRVIVDLYLRNAHRANNWDLVDLSAPYILGSYLLAPLPDCTLPSTDILDRLSADTNLWRQRIAIVSTAALIRAGRYDETLRIASRLLTHPHDLIHKATGWMLREVGKRDTDTLRRFLDARHAAMSRTTLRYAIERLSPAERHHYLRL